MKAKPETRLTRAWSHGSGGSFLRIQSRVSFIGLMLVIGLTSSFAAASVPGSGQLLWQNGESMTGELGDATGEEVSWKSPLFQEPLHLYWHGLHRFHQTHETVATPDLFSFTCRDGSFFYGDLLAVGEESLTIRSARHKTALLKRSEVLCVRRVKGGAFSGLQGTVGWTLLRKDSNARMERSLPLTESLPIPPLLDGPGGALRLPYWNWSVSRDVKLPELLDFQFRVSASGRPDFQMALAGTGTSGLAVETWGDELVLTVGDQFKSIRKLEESERVVALRLLWNQRLKTCVVYSDTGESLIDWQVPEEAGTPSPGLVLRNKGRSLSLEFLQMRAWNGKPLGKNDPLQPQVELSDGRILQGQVTGGTAGFISVRTAEPALDTQVPMDGVEAVVFPLRPLQAQASPSTLVYADGTFLSGQLIGIREGRAVLATAFSEAPFFSDIQGLRQLSNRVSRPMGAAAELPVEQLDKLVNQGISRRGQLVCQGGVQAGWLPVSGVRPAGLARDVPFEILRAFPETVPLSPVAALFYTRGGDVLPGVLRGVEPKAVEVESGLFGVAKLSAAQLDGIQFLPEARLAVRGFQEGWRVLKGSDQSIHRENGLLRMEPETLIGHASAMVCREISFRYQSTGFSVVRLKLFCAGLSGAKSTNLLLSHMGQTLCFGVEQGGGDVERQVRVQIPNGQPVLIRLFIRSGSVDLSVNGGAVNTFAIDPAKRAGDGLLIEPGSMWGNPVQPILLSDFSGMSDVGKISMPVVSPEAKEQALSVPRFRRESPPRQILVASNGDVLRGEIESVSATHFGFRAGLGELAIPRERVQAAIWVKKSEPALPISALKRAALTNLERPLEETGIQAEVNVLVDFIKTRAPELKFSLPEKSVSRALFVRFHGGSVGQFLDLICTTFDLRYRVDADGVIVLENGALAGLPARVYWLKDVPFPDTETGKGVLMGKGITFPDSAELAWNPVVRQLSMTNTPENHEKLARLLDADLGGVLGSPTHWLLLSSGGRLGLSVEQFGGEFVTGWNPLYGRCSVPLATICVLRNTQPEPSGTMRSFASWGLVDAPEPVLAEPGSEKTSGLDKPAPLFKLPLLSGGEFDLAAQKGQVVVLDFWATWCGPCIKAMPELLEALAGFSSEQVKLIGVNQAESTDEVKRFLERRRWNLNVAMDGAQTVGRQYGVDGIPHTVIVGRDGKVAWEKTGYDPEDGKAAAEVVRKLLAAP